MEQLSTAPKMTSVILEDIDWAGLCCVKDCKIYSKKMFPSIPALEKNGFTKVECIGKFDQQMGKSVTGRAPQIGKD